MNRWEGPLTIGARTHRLLTDEPSLSSATVLLHPVEIAPGRNPVTEPEPSPRHEAGEDLYYSDHYYSDHMCLFLEHFATV
jgi:hypothetical protein